MRTFPLYFTLGITESLSYLIKPTLGSWNSMRPLFNGPQDWDRPNYQPESDLTRVGGNGEWEDWLGEEAFIGDDEMGSDDDDDEDKEDPASAVQPPPAESIPKSFTEWKLVGGGGGGGSEALGGWDNLLKSSNGGGIGKSASENWAGWSEEAPFFEDEPEERAPMASLGSSDLWTRSEPEVAPQQASSFVERASFVPQPPSAVVDLSLVEIKMQGLNREVSSLKTFVALLVGLVIGLELGDRGF